MGQNQAWGVQNNGGGGSGGATVTPVTKSELLAFIGANAIENTTYQITDIDGFEAVYVQGIAPNIVSQDGFGFGYIPSYEITGVYKGQLLASDSVTIGDKWAWGNKVWESTTGVNSEPITAFELDSADWDLTPYSDAGYILQQFVLKYDLQSDLIVYCNQLPENNECNSSDWLFSQLGVTAFNGLQWATDNYITKQNDCFSVNNRTPLILNNGELFIINNDGVGGVKENHGSAGNNYIQKNQVGTYCEIAYNHLSISSVYEDNVLIDGGKLISNTSVNSEIANNHLEGDNVNIGYGFQNDAGDVKDNFFQGSNITLQAFQQNNNSKINGNTVVGSDVSLGGTSQLKLDQVNDNVIYGSNIEFNTFTQNGNSKINGFTIGSVGSPINVMNVTNIEQSNASLLNGAFTVAKSVRNIYMANCTVENFTDISLEGLNIEGVDLDLAGFTQDIIGETISSSKGFFTINHDFTANPLVVGVPKLYNIIPTSARITLIKAIGTMTDGGGAHLQVGLSADDDALLSFAIGAYATGKTFDTFSAQATANRSLQLEALNSNITGGSISVYVEFML